MVAVKRTTWLALELKEEQAVEGDASALTTCTHAGSSGTHSWLVLAYPAALVPVLSRPATPHAHAGSSLAHLIVGVQVEALEPVGQARPVPHGLIKPRVAPELDGAG